MNVNKPAQNFGPRLTVEGGDLLIALPAGETERIRIGESVPGDMAIINAIRAAWAAWDGFAALPPAAAPEPAATDPAPASSSSGRPKLEYVSFYSVKAKRRGVRWRVSYTIPGRPRMTDRLGPSEAAGYRWARTVSETLAQVHARQLSADEAYRRLAIDRRPITTLVDKFENSLRTKKVDGDYLASTIYRVKECLDAGDITRLDQLTKSAAERLTEKLLTRETKAGSGKLITNVTVNGYLKALKTFSRWLAKTSRVTDDPLRYVGGVKAVEGGRRRDAQLEDVKSLYAAAMADATNKRSGVFKGPDRAILYVYAFATGLRLSELRAAQVEWLSLGESRSVINVPGSVTKNGRPAVQPIPAWLASATVSWLGKRTTGQIWPDMPASMSRIFDKDRATANLEFWTDEGKLVFHSFRHGYASALLDSDVESKLVQSLMRHSTITLLFDRYGHARKSKANNAVESAIPSPLPAKKIPAEGDRDVHPP